MNADSFRAILPYLACLLLILPAAGGAGGATADPDSETRAAAFFEGLHPTSSRDQLLRALALGLLDDQAGAQAALEALGTNNGTLSVGGMSSPLAAAIFVFGMKVAGGDLANGTGAGTSAWTDAGENPTVRAWSLLADSYGAPPTNETAAAAIQILEADIPVGFIGFLTRHVEQPSTTHTAQIADLVASVEADGSVNGDIVQTAFALMTLRAVEQDWGLSTNGVDDAMEAWLREQQASDGAWYADGGPYEATASVGLALRSPHIGAKIAARHAFSPGGSVPMVNQGASDIEVFKLDRYEIRMNIPGRGWSPGETYWYNLGLRNRGDQATDVVAKAYWLDAAGQLSDPGERTLCANVTQGAQGYCTLPTTLPKDIASGEATLYVHLYALADGRDLNAYRSPYGVQIDRNESLENATCLGCDSLFLCNSAIDPSCPPSLSPEWTIEMPQRASADSVFRIVLVGPELFDATLYRQFPGDLSGVHPVIDFNRSLGLATGDYTYEAFAVGHRQAYELGVMLRNPGNGAETLYYLGEVTPTSIDGSESPPASTSPRPASPSSPSTPSQVGPTAVPEARVPFPAWSTVVVALLIASISVARLRPHGRHER